MNYIVVDFEMNAMDKNYREERKICRMEIIEIGAVVMDENFLVLGEFKTLVKPQYNKEVYKRYERLTGISTQMLDNALSFDTAYEMFEKWCNSYGDAFEIYAWSDSDKVQLVAEMTLKGYSDLENNALLGHWNDFQKEYMDKLGVERAVSLEKALMYAGIDFEGHQHDALCDAKNTAKLFAVVRDEARCRVALKSAMEAFSPKNVGGTLGDRFDFANLLAQVG